MQLGVGRTNGRLDLQAEGLHTAVNLKRNGTVYLYSVAILLSLFWIVYIRTYMYLLKKPKVIPTKAASPALLCPCLLDIYTHTVMFASVF